MRDEIYGHFLRSQNSLRAAGDQVFSAAQRFPYFALSNETRDALSSNITFFLRNCSKPTNDYLGRNATLPMFDYTTNNTSPIEIAFKPVKDILDQIIAVASSVNIDTQCLRTIGLGFSRFERTFTAVVNYINQCTRLLSLTYRPAITEFTRLHFVALPVVNRLATDLNSCASNWNLDRETCAKKIIDNLSSSSSSICMAL